MSAASYVDNRKVATVNAAVILGTHRSWVLIGRTQRLAGGNQTERLTPTCGDSHLLWIVYGKRIYQQQSNADGLMRWTIQVRPELNKA